MASKQRRKNNKANQINNKQNKTGKKTQQRPGFPATWQQMSGAAQGCPPSTGPPRLPQASGFLDPPLLSLPGCAPALPARQAAFELCPAASVPRWEQTSLESNHCFYCPDETVKSHMRIHNQLQ